MEARRRFSKWLPACGAGVLLLLLAGCASSPKRVALTGDLMVDGANAIQHGPRQDKVLWEFRTAAAAMRQGRFELANQYLGDAQSTLQGIYGPDPNARKARAYFHAESKKTFIGEPYERSMAYIYLGLLYWMRGEADNARACFRGAEFEDSDAENHAYAGDWILPDYLDGLITAKLGGDGSDAFKRAQANAKNIQLAPYNRDAHVFCLIEFGPGPTKYATGQYDEELRFMVPQSPVVSASIRVDAIEAPVLPVDDVGFQAQTRGGRVMDHILHNKAVFKSTTDTAGNVAIVGGLATAGLSHDRTAEQAGLAIALAGLVSKGISAATTPQADTRAWDNLPRYLGFVPLSLTPGEHVLTIEFRNAAGSVLPNLTKTLTVHVPYDGKDLVIFVSDQSKTPQSV